VALSRETLQGVSARAGAYGAVLGDGVEATGRTVEGVHGAVARVTFRVLRAIPVVNVVAAIVELLHNAIARRAHGAVRAGAAGLASAARTAAASEVGVPAPIGRREAVLRSVLNGTHGDYLAASGSPLATRMAFCVDGTPLEAGELPSALEDATGRVCVFVHGMCMDDRAWRRAEADATGLNYGDKLRDALGFTPLYLRYNTGLPPADTGREMAERLEELLEACPGEVSEIVLVGHSMGGLVAHYACDAATTAGLQWIERASLVITLGAPFHGSPVAKVGHVANEALKAFRTTRPLGEMAEARSVGVRELRHPHPVASSATDEAPARRSVRYRYLSGGLLASDAGTLGRIVGDGLVQRASAHPSGVAPGDTAHIAGAGHLALLNEPRVYAQIEAWIAEAGRG
jgi:pimeloyl-ACP methyl ester carboxylesterase